MASSAEMLRVMQHTAAKLDACRNVIAGRSEHGSATRSEVDHALMAMAYAAGVLRMVGSCVMDDPHPLAPVLARLRDGSYQRWAEVYEGLVMSDGELAAVADFLASEEESRG